MSLQEISQIELGKLKELILSGQKDSLFAYLDDFRPEDIAETFWDLEEENQKEIIAILEKEKAVNVIVSLDYELQEKFLRTYDTEAIATEILEYLNTDDAVDILNHFSSKKAEEIINYLQDQEFARNLMSLLHYDENVAGGLMEKELIKVRLDWTMSRCVEEIRKQAEIVEHVYTIYAVDDRDRLKGIVSLKQLVLQKEGVKVEDILNEDFIYVSAYSSGEEVASVMNKYDLVAVPVVDSLGRLMGRITIDDVVDFIKEEADRDFQLQAGLTENVESSDRIWILSRARLPWLLIGLTGGLASSSLVQRFEGDLQIFPQLAFFMPVVAAMGGNAGVQSSAIIVQGLANNTLKSKNISPKLVKEFFVSLLNGAVCSIIMFAWNLFIGHTMELSLTVSVALITVIIFASILGTLTPLLLEKFKIDPALATGPFITTTNDVVGLGFYFLIGRLILNHMI
jgi:magnesium transporter